MASTLEGVGLDEPLLEPKQPGRGRRITKSGQEIANRVVERASEVTSMLKWQVLYVLLYFAVGIVYYGNVCGWSWVDSLYFAVAVVTSVGYGDVIPPQENGPVLFTCVYMTAAILIIASAISKVADAFLSGKVTEALSALERAQEANMRNMIEEELNAAESTLFGEWKEEASVKRRNKVISLLKAAGVTLVCMAAGTMSYMALEPAKGDDEATIDPWVRGVYFSITTLTTVGFGDVTPKTDAFKLIDVVFMVVGIPVFGNFLAKVMAFGSEDEAVEAQLFHVESLDESRMTDLLNFEAELHELTEGKVSADGQTGTIDLTEYLAFILVRNKVIKMSTLKDIVRSFQKLDVDGSGSISHDDILGRRKTTVAVGQAEGAPAEVAEEESSCSVS